VTTSAEGKSQITSGLKAVPQGPPGGIFSCRAACFLGRMEAAFSPNPLMMHKNTYQEQFLNKKGFSGAKIHQNTFVDEG
jgi:hypothetical protein